MSTHIEWADAAMSHASCVPASEVNSLAEDDDRPVLIMGVSGDTVMAFTGSTDEIASLLHDALSAVNSYGRRPTRPGYAR